MKNFKTKKKYLYHLGNLNSPLPLQPACGVDILWNLGPSCFTKFTLELKIRKRHYQLVQLCSLMCGDTAYKNEALGGWVG